MSQELATQPPPELKPVSSLQILAGRLNADPDKLFNTLKQTVFKGCTNEEIMVLTVVANEYGLNPLIKELYAFPAKGGGIVPIVSIDGWLRITNDHPQMNGLETTYSEEGGKLISCTCKIWRKDREYPIVATEYLSECKRGTEPWKMEHRMLRHKSIIQCARIAFGFSGIHDEDEGGVIGERKVRGREVARTEALSPFDPPAAIDQPEPQDDYDQRAPEDGADNEWDGDGVEGGRAA